MIQFDLLSTRVQLSALTIRGPGKDSLKWGLVLVCALLPAIAGASLENQNSTEVITNHEPAIPLRSTEAQSAATNRADSLDVALSKLPSELVPSDAQSERIKTQLELARHYRHIRLPSEAEPVLIDLLAESSPEPIKQQALLELAMAVKEQGDLPRAQQIYAQYFNRWPNDLLIPEIMMRQGKLFREMGMNNLALAKFYAVMTSSLVLKNDKLDYYQKLVLAAQTEIAETHFQLGKYAEAADFFSRLLKQGNPALNRANAQYRLIKSLSALERNDETVARGQEFLKLYPDAPEQPEVRFHVALALKRLNRNGEALQQVLSLLQEQKERTKEHPDLWAYWQEQAGNEIGNQLYHEGDYVRALNIYLALAQLNSQPAWQLPVGYQIGLTYERLKQPEKAVQSYQSVLQHETELGTNASPGTKAILEMARWRSQLVQWQAKAETTGASHVGLPPVTQAKKDSTPALGNP